jgi:hypothetical protein
MPYALRALSLPRRRGRAQTAFFLSDSLAVPGRPLALPGGWVGIACQEPATMAATNKCLARSNKTRTGAKAINKREQMRYDPPDRLSPGIGLDWALRQLGPMHASKLTRRRT